MLAGCMLMSTGRVVAPLVCWLGDAVFLLSRELRLGTHLGDE